MTMFLFAVDIVGAGGLHFISGEDSFLANT
jgi:hypothetical protein